MKFLVRVMPRDEALDPQGRAVQGALERMDFAIKDCRIGKAIIIDLETTDKQVGLQKVNEMSAKLLANPLIETYEVTAL